MAKYIAAAPANGFTVEEVTQGQVYPSSEVEQYIHDPTLSDEPGITEEQAIRTVEETVDTTDVVRKGEGAGIVYAYGYRCCAGRLKVGFTEANTVQLDISAKALDCDEQIVAHQSRCRSGIGLAVALQLPPSSNSFANGPPVVKDSTLLVRADHDGHIAGGRCTGSHISLEVHALPADERLS